MVKGRAQPDYHVPNRPHFDAIEIKGGGDAASAARAVLQTGEFDYAWNLQVEDEVLKRMEGERQGPRRDQPERRHRDDPAQHGRSVDRSRRRARQPEVAPSRSCRTPRCARRWRCCWTASRVQEFVYGRTGVATANVLNNPRQFNSPNTKNESSLDKANALLDGAGWKRGADGIREKDGRKLSFCSRVRSTRCARRCRPSSSRPAPRPASRSN